MQIDVDALKASADIVSVVSSYLTLKKRGNEYVGVCPFHADTDPSLHVVPAKGFAHCFVCDANHDVISFVQEMDGVDFKTACERLGAKTFEPKERIQHEAKPPPDRATSKPPESAAPPNFHVRGLGDPSKTYTLRETDGSLIAYECRYETQGKKEIRIWSWGSRGDRPACWGIGHLNKPRPLYGLDRLAANPKSAVLITEGPKKADAGAALLPSYACLSWTGGAMAWHKHDYAPIAGRTVLIWPDNDEPGRSVAVKLAGHLSDPRTLGCRVRIVDPTGQPDAWDIADALEEGWDTDKLIAWAKPRATDYVEKQVLERHDAPNELPPLSAYADEATAPVPSKKANGASHPIAQPSAAGVMWRRMSDIKPERTNWLWPDRIACGEISFLTGNPGLGKSQITASLASIVTNGGLWPVDRTRAPQGTVIILSAEDNTSKTIRPRLDAAEADVSRVIVLDAVRHITTQGDELITGFSLAEDIAKLGALIYELTDVRLVIIDPISAYLGDVDSHNNAEVRGLLAPLQKMAETHDVAVLCVTHQNKSSGMEALLKMQGSLAFSAAARGVWGVVKDKENPSRRYFLPLKNNLGEDKTGFAYSIESHFTEPANPDEDKIPTSRVLWELEPVTASIEELFSSGQSHEETGAMADCKAFLRDLLAQGPVTSKQIEVDARGAGHSMTTLRRAAGQMRVRIAKEGYGSTGAWKWSLN